MARDESQKPTTKEYVENYKKIFQKKKEEEKDE